jgi:hypothetical protein
MSQSGTADRNLATCSPMCVVTARSQRASRWRWLLLRGLLVSIDPSIKSNRRNSLGRGPDGAHGVLDWNPTRQLF